MERQRRARGQGRTDEGEKLGPVALQLSRLGAALAVGALAVGFAGLLVVLGGWTGVERGTAYAMGSALPLCGPLGRLQPGRCRLRNRQGARLGRSLLPATWTSWLARPHPG